MARHLFLLKSSRAGILLLLGTLCLGRGIGLGWQSWAPLAWGWGKGFSLGGQSWARGRAATLAGIRVGDASLGEILRIPDLHLSLSSLVLTRLLQTTMTATTSSLQRAPFARSGIMAARGLASTSRNVVVVAGQRSPPPVPVCLASALPVAALPPTHPFLASSLAGHPSAADACSSGTDGRLLCCK